MVARMNNDIESNRWCSSFSSAIVPEEKEQSIFVAWTPRRRSEKVRGS
jgi:hypothetical protein